jgi:hypothetical protein
VAAWLDRSAHHVTLEHCEGLLASALPAVPSFAPRGGLKGPRGGRGGRRNDDSPEPPTRGPRARRGDRAVA